MSDFFRPPARREPEPVHEQPPWLGPPDNELGAPVPIRLLLARTESVAIALHDAVAYSTGVEFALEVRLRDKDELSDPFGLRFRQSLRPEAELSDDVLRLGFELADGRRVTNIGGFPGFEQPPQEPVLIQRGGGGGSRSWSFRYWLWPLPPAGALIVVVEWPSQDVPLTRFELAAERLLEAAAESEQLWPGGRPSGGGGFVTQQQIG